MSEIVLFDIPSTPPCKCWSPNTWKARLLLNYKQIPYRTEWIEYPDIEPTFEPLVAPNPPELNHMKYSIPTLKIGGKYIMDSKLIAMELSRQYPEPKLPVEDAPHQEKVIQLLGDIRRALLPDWLPLNPEHNLNPSSVEYWYRTRSETVGAPLKEWALANGRHTEKPWQAATPHMEELAGLFKEHPEGPFLLGKQPSFTDFAVVSWLRFMQILEPSWLSRYTDADPVYATLFEACKPWFENDK